MEWIYRVSKSDLAAAGIKHAAIIGILKLSGVSFFYSCSERKAQEGRKSLAWREEKIPFRGASEAGMSAKMRTPYYQKGRGLWGVFHFVRLGPYFNNNDIK